MSGWHLTWFQNTIVHHHQKVLHAYVCLLAKYSNNRCMGLMKLTEDIYKMCS